MVKKAILLSVVEQIGCCVQLKQEFRRKNVIVYWLRPRVVVFIIRKVIFIGCWSVKELWS